MMIREMWFRVRMHEIKKQPLPMMKKIILQRLQRRRALTLNMYMTVNITSQKPQQQQTKNISLPMIIMAM